MREIDREKGIERATEIERERETERDGEREREREREGGSNLPLNLSRQSNFDSVIMCPLKGAYWIRANIAIAILNFSLLLPI